MKVRHVVSISHYQKRGRSFKAQQGLGMVAQYLNDRDEILAEIETDARNFNEYLKVTLAEIEQRRQLSRDFAKSRHEIADKKVEGALSILAQIGEDISAVSVEIVEES